MSMHRPCGPPSADGRRWYPVERVALPAREASAGEIVAAVTAQRRRLGRVHEWDERIETSIRALHRALWRRGHGEKSGRWACSLAQLIDSPLADVLGWKRRRDRSGRWRYFYDDGTRPMTRAQFIRAHRRQLQRLLDFGQAAGLWAHTPERDQRGQWWRTVIALHAPPVVDAQLLEAARAYVRPIRLRARERRRQARRRPHERRRRLGAILQRVRCPSSRVRAQLARTRAAAAHERRRRLAVEQAIATGARRAAAAAAVACDHLTHPFGAPPTSEHLQRSSEACQQDQPPPARSVHRFAKVETAAVETSARDRALLAQFSPAQRRTWQECSQESEGTVDLGALIAARVARRTESLLERREILVPQLQARALSVARWPDGKPCPFGLLAEAWAVYRYGPEQVAEGGYKPLAGRLSQELARKARKAIAAYEQAAASRPPGWPSGGAAALTVLAASPTISGEQRAALRERDRTLAQPPDRLAGDVARLHILARGMAALAAARRPDRGERALRRLQRRQLRITDAPLRIEFRRDARPTGLGWAIVTGAEFARRQRDSALLAGEPLAPELDGRQARALHHLEQLRLGLWGRPTRWPFFDLETRT